MVIKCYHNRLLDYYKERGYGPVRGVEFEVKVSDLHEKSMASVRVICDYCGEEYEMTYNRYNKDVLGGEVKKCACRNCGEKKAVDAVMSKYGVASTTCLPEVREKQKATCVERLGVPYPTMNKDVLAKRDATCYEKYGCKIPTQNKEVKDKAKKTMLEKYGYEHPSNVPEIQERRKQTFVERYGVDNPFRLDETKEKSRNTMFSKYGVTNGMQCKEIASKARRTLYLRGNAPSSKAQRELCLTLGGKLNYPVEIYSADILCNGHIVVEYDGGGHRLMVRHGKYSDGEFNDKETERLRVFKNLGYKIIRVTNPKDKKLNYVVLAHNVNIIANRLISCGGDYAEYDCETGEIKLQQQSIKGEPSVA